MAALIYREAVSAPSVGTSSGRNVASFLKIPTRAGRSEHDEYANIPSADNSRGVSVEYHSPNRSEEV